MELMHAVAGRVAIVILLASAVLAGCAARSPSAHLESASRCPDDRCASFEALVDSRMLRAGDRVRILSQTGQDVRGTLIGLSGTELVARVADQRMALGEEDVAAVWQRRSVVRSMVRPAAIGAATGLVVGSLFRLSTVVGDCEDDPASVEADECFYWSDALYLSVSTGIVGAVIGIFRRDERQVYDAVGRPIAVSLQPRLGPRGAALRVVLTR